MKIRVEASYPMPWRPWARRKYAAEIEIDTEPGRPALPAPRTYASADLVRANVLEEVRAALWGYGTAADPMAGPSAWEAIKSKLKVEP